MLTNRKIHRRPFLWLYLHFIARPQAIFGSSIAYMQQWVSWDELLVMIAVGGTAWYGAVAFRYYRRELTEFFRTRPAQQWHRQRGPLRVAAKHETDADAPANGDEQVKTPVPAPVLPGHPANPHTLVHELLEALKPIFAAWRLAPPSKSAAMAVIAQHLPPYRSLDATLRQAINQYLVNETSLHLTEPLTLEDIASLW